MPATLLGPIKRLANDTYIGPCSFTEAVIAEYCAAGCFEPGVERMIGALRGRRDAMLSAVDRHLGGRVEYTKPGGGYFLWLRIPGVDCDALTDRSVLAGVPVVKGSGCYLDGRGKDCIRLAYSACQAGDMDEAIERLARLI